MSRQTTLGRFGFKKSILHTKLYLSFSKSQPRILKAKYGTTSSLLLDILKWDSLVIKRKKHKALMMFKSLNEQAPVYLQNLFHERSTDYDLRNSSFLMAVLSCGTLQKCERN